MTDLPKTINIDLSNDPALAAMLQALVVSREANRQQLIKSQEAYEAQIAQHASDPTGRISLEVDVLPPAPPKPDLAGVALEALRDGVATQLQRHDVLGVQYGVAGVPVPMPRLIGRHR